MAAAVRIKAMRVMDTAKITTLFREDAGWSSSKWLVLASLLVFFTLFAMVLWL